MKNKQFIAGFITCLILLSAIFISGFAENALTVMPNPFPILFNGQPAPIKSYNIDGLTYLPLGEITKLFGGSAKLNEVTQVIEINTNVEEVKTVSTAIAIEYDPITGLPAGAVYIDNEKNGRKYKTISYNEKIYISEPDLQFIYGINYIRNIQYKDFVFGKGNAQVTIDFMQRENILKVNSRVYINIKLFSDLIGE